MMVKSIPAFKNALIFYVLICWKITNYYSDDEHACVHKPHEWVQ